MVEMDIAIGKIVPGDQNFTQVKEEGGESVSMGVRGLVNEASCRWEETVLIARGLVLMDGTLLPEGRVL